MRKEIVLGGIGYFVTVQDGQVIFEESRPMWGIACHAFTFERTPDSINRAPGIWKLAHIDIGSCSIPASHITGAVEYCEKTFGKSFEPYKDELAHLNT